MKRKITEKELNILGYVKFNETEKCKHYNLDEKLFPITQENCDVMWEYNISLYNDGTCIMGGEAEIEDIFDIRNFIYKTFLK